jgi:hypothetical protein
MVKTIMLYKPLSTGMIGMVEIIAFSRWMLDIQEYTHRV